MADENIIPLELPAPAAEPAAEVDVDAKVMLREFEDKHLGPHATRIDGHIEKGHGAHFHNLKDHHKAHHGALVRFVQAEETMMKAMAELSAAKTKHAEAKAAVQRHADAK